MLYVDALSEKIDFKNDFEQVNNWLICGSGLQIFNLKTKDKITTTFEKYHNGFDGKLDNVTIYRMNVYLNGVLLTVVDEENKFGADKAKEQISRMMEFVDKYEDT